MGKKAITVLLIAMLLLWPQSFAFAVNDSTSNGTADSPMKELRLELSNDSKSGKIVLAWKKMDKIKQYKIYRSKEREGSYSLIGTTTGSNYTDTGAITGNRYYYQVKGFVGIENKTISCCSPITARTCRLSRPDMSTKIDTVTGKPVISWKAVNGADKYAIFRAVGKGGTYKELIKTGNTSYKDKNAVVANTYYYKVKAINTESPSADSSYSLYGYKTCDFMQPIVRIGNVASTGKIKLSWGRQKRADRYYVYRALSEKGKYSLVKKTTATSFIDKNTKSGKKYYYKVRAIDDNVATANSALSKPAYRICDLPAPKVTVKNNLKTGKPIISWKKVAGADKYALYCATSQNGTYKKIAVTTRNTITHTKAKTGIKYYYKVAAIDNGNLSAKSGYSVVQKRICDLPVPVISCSLNSKGKPVVSWKKVKSANKYGVYRKTGVNGTYKLVGTTSKLSYTDSKAIYGKKCYYRVKALYPDVEGAASARSAAAAITTINPNQKMVALTFDDGPGPYTTRIVNCLKKNNGKATFFVLGQRVKGYPKATKSIYNGGNEIGNHSYSHPMLYDLSKSGIKSQISRTDAAVYKYTGVKPKIMRPPGGAVNSLVKTSVGKPIIMWSIDTLDWQTRSKSATVNCVMRNVSDGDIVLMHDIHEPTMEAALELIPKLRAKGYQLVTVSDLAKFRGAKLKPGKIYYYF